MGQGVIASDLKGYLEARLIDDLLKKARADEGRSPLSIAEIALDDIELLAKIERRWKYCSDRVSVSRYGEKKDDEYDSTSM